MSMRMQVILDSYFVRPGSAPIWGGKKGEFRDWTSISRTQAEGLFVALHWKQNWNFGFRFSFSHDFVQQNCNCHFRFSPSAFSWDIEKRYLNFDFRFRVLFSSLQSRLANAIWACIFPCPIILKKNGRHSSLQYNWQFIYMGMWLKHWHSIKKTVQLYL